MTAIAIVSGAYGTFLHFHDVKTYPKEEIEGWFEPITTKYGIRIAYEIGDDFFSPVETPLLPAGPLRHSKVTPIRHRVLKNYPEILQTAFKKYPVEVIKKYLKTIQLAAEIDDGIVKYGGTIDPFRKIVYLADKGTKSDDLVINNFHHEFSTLLMTSHSFYVNLWTDHNPAGFEYFYDKYDDWTTMEKHRDKVTDFYEKGMVSNYGLTNFSNDFSEYSAMILTYPQKFKTVMNQYPRIRGKFLIWLEFYQKIDPIFTETHLLGG